MPLDKIDSMRAFVAVAQEASFTAAARRLGTSTTLVSKSIARLESRLETQLFNRTTRSVALTAVGAAYLEHCRPLLEQFDELDALVQERQGALAGPIRITAPTGFGSTHLASALAPFLLDHPAVEVDLRLSDALVPLVEEGFDLAIRIGVLRDSTLVARKLADMPLVVCAAPDYLARRGRPSDPTALATHSCLLDDYRSDAVSWRFRDASRDLAVKVSGSVRANAPAALARLALGGLGIARCPLYAVEAALKEGRLERLFPDFKIEESGLYALYPPNRHLTARVRALIDHLARELAG
ncbi:MAG: LysR family transcriptional regulator [Rhodospirillales bacterium]